MRKKITICILYITSLVFLLSGCGGIRNFQLQYDVDSGEAYYTDSKNGTVYFRIDKRGYVPCLLYTSLLFTAAGQYRSGKCKTKYRSSNF